MTQFNTVKGLEPLSTYRGPGLRLCLLGVSACLAATVLGCAAPNQVRFQPQRYKIEVRLDPGDHTIEGHVAMDLVRIGDDPPKGVAAVELLLHPDLEIMSVRGGGVDASLPPPGTPMPSSMVSSKDREFSRSHWVQIDRAPSAMTLFVSYKGRLKQDVAAGEKAGQIHNFEMKAHIGEEGIYLADGYWYPEPAHPSEEPPPLAHYALLADRIPDMVLVAGGDEDGSMEAQTGRQAWQSPYPMSKMVLVGGHHAVHRASHNGVELAVHLSAANADQAEGLIAAAKKNLDRYVPLVGPYPARQYTIVENFFSSGFAFPCFTLLSSAVIQMGERGWGRHGYLDHEFLHSWWGAGVHVDPRDGNWCESLASYGANYYGFILDGDEEGARKKRRNICHFLSRIKEEDDKPLGTYGLPEGCSRSVAHDKGAMVFYMLAREMSDQTFWTAVKRLNREHLGEYASWSDIQRVMEDEGGEDLDVFFEQWVRTGGAPLIEIVDGEQIPEGVRLSIAQHPAFMINDVVCRTIHGDSQRSVEPKREDRQFTIASETEHIEFRPQPGDWPISVELDPDYQIFRRISPEFILPTTSSTRSGTAFTVVLPQGDVPEQLQKLSKTFQSSFEPNERVVKSAAEVRADKDLAERCALILGEAVREPTVNAFLAAIEFPVRWSDEGFAFEDQEFVEPGHAIMCTVRHPGVPGGGVTVVYGNSEAGIPRAELIPFYENSMVIFKDGIPVLRRDFEPRQVVPVRMLNP